MTRKRPDRAGFSIERRRLLRTLPAVGITSVAGCTEEGETETSVGGRGGNGTANESDGDEFDDDETPDDEPDDAEDESDESDEGSEMGVRFVLNPGSTTTDVVSEYTPLAEYLEAETGVSVELERAYRPTETLTALEHGDAELADTTPFAVPHGDADLVGIRRALGSAFYFSVIATTPDSDVDRLADLEGETIAADATTSLSSGLVPAVMLEDAGLDMGSFPNGEPRDLDVVQAAHDIARDHLVERNDIVAAATGAFAVASQIPRAQFDDYPSFVEHSAEYESAGERIGDEPELQLLAVSDPLPRAPILTRSDWDDPVREDIEDALLRAGPSDLRGDDEHELWFTDVVPGDRGDYRPIAEVLERLPVEYEDLV